MLAERKPSDLFQEYQTNNLEKIVLQLSKLDYHLSHYSSVQTTEKETNMLPKTTVQIHPPTIVSQNGGCWTGAIERTKALVRKNLLMLTRTPL